MSERTEPRRIGSARQLTNGMKQVRLGYLQDSKFRVRYEMEVAWDSEARRVIAEWEETGSAPAHARDIRDE